MELLSFFILFLEVVKKYSTNALLFMANNSRCYLLGKCSVFRNHPKMPSLYTHAGFVRSEKMLTLRVIFISAEEDEERNLRRISYLRATKEDRTQPYYSDEDDGGLSRHLSGGHKR